MTADGREPLVVLAPLAGRTVALPDVPDEVFARAMLGPGVAIDPGGTGQVDVVSPIDGVIAALAPHAFVVQAPDGRAVLVHLGLDTVRLLGETFVLDSSSGDAVRAGQVVVTWDLATTVERGNPALCPVIAMQAPAAEVDAPGSGLEVSALDRLLVWR